MEEQQANVDWKALESALERAIVARVADFAREHSEETFYGFALDCNAYYANVLFCLNTPESLDASIREYSKSDDPAEIDRQREDLEWGLGDWKYQGFNLDSPRWLEEMGLLEEYAELPSDEDTEQFLVGCCRALIAAERNGAFSPLNRTPAFRVACIDHDEDGYSGDRRLERVRAAS